MKVRILLGLLTGLLSLIFMAAFGYLGYNFGQEIGSSTAYQASFDIGYQDAFNLNYEEGYQLGYEEALETNTETGYSDGYEIGYDDGFESGYEDSYAYGESAGYEEGYASGYAQGSNRGVNDASDSNYQAGILDGKTLGETEIIEALLDYRSQDIRNLMIRNGASCNNSQCEILTYEDPNGRKTEWRKYDFTSRSFYAYSEYYPEGSSSMNKQRVEINLISGLITAEVQPINNSFVSPGAIYDKSVNRILKNTFSGSNADRIDWFNDWTDSMEAYLSELKLEWLIMLPRDN
jgi:hypothetical protein